MPIRRASLPATLLLASALLLPAAVAQAVDYKSVGAAPAVLYDAPSDKGRKVYVAPRGMPVEVVLTYGDWTKVRDAGGDLAWVPSKALVASRSLVTLSAARVRAAADEASPVVINADKGILLELQEPASSGWLRVRHRDGLTGYVRAADVWGE